MSPALAGGFLTTAPPGMSPSLGFSYACKSLNYLLLSGSVGAAPVSALSELFVSSIFVGHLISSNYSSA